MYITCPRCRTSFVVLPEQIGSIGRKVKCSKCSNIWYQKLKEDLQIKSVIPALRPELTTARTSYSNQYGSGINLPALLPIKIPEYLYVLPIFLISLIVVLSLILFYDMWGLHNLEHNKLLSIKDVHVTNDTKLGKIIINYTILNSSDKILTMPLVRIRLFDSGHSQLKSHIDDHSNVALSPKQYVRIKTEFPSAPDKTEQIDIMLGNQLDFMLR